jgi:nucleotide-binding universal stress UspA family protein
MKKILVPTDFSENALKALKYAINIANSIDASLIVLHAYHVSQGAGSLVSLDQIIQDDREQEMYNLIHSVKPLLKENIILESHVKYGNAVDLTIRAAEQLDVDLILMGTTGADAIKKMFMGSTARNIIKNTDKAVLAIPLSYEGDSLTDITLALDNKTLRDNTVLNPLIELIKINNAILNLLVVVDDEEENIKIDADLISYFKLKNIEHRFSKISANSVSEGIIEFVRQNGSNLLCLIHHNRSWYENIFHRSVSENMAYESQVPLLVIRD